MTREEAIRIIEVAKAEAEWEAPLDYQIAFDLAIEALRQQAQRWIPVKERLPEADGRYLVTCSSGVWGTVDWNICDWNIWNNVPKPSWVWEHGVTAWMPLPEPYKEENDNG